MRPFASLLLGLVACDSIDTVSLVGDDAPPRTVETDPGIDAPPDARPLRTVGVSCDPYVRTVQYADGQRIVTTNRFGIVAGVRPDDDFTVERCGLMLSPSPDACPPGATCTGTGQPQWGYCERSYRSGTFMNQKLLVYCGQTVENFAADGTLLGTSGLSYFSIKVIY